MNYIQQAVHLYVQKVNEYKKAAEAKGARTGIYIGGGQVSLNGITYNADLNSDINLHQGQAVCVMLNQSGTKAVILG